MENETMEKKLKELQKYTPQILNMLNSSKNGGKISVSSVKLEKMYEILIGKIKCKAIHLIQIEEFMRRLTPNASKEQNKSQELKTAPQVSKTAPQEDCIEIIHLDSSDEDDVEIVSVTAPQPKNSSSLEDTKQSRCEVPNEQTSPDKLEDAETENSNPNTILVENEGTEKCGEETPVTTNKLSTLDADNNNLSLNCVPELNILSDKKETLVVTINNNLAQSCTSKKMNKVKKHSVKKHKEKKHKDKKMKINLKPEVSSTVRKVCDTKYNIPALSSVVIIPKNVSRPIGKTLKESRKRAEVSSTTSMSRKRSHKIRELDKSSKVVVKTEKARSIDRIGSVTREPTKETQDNTVTASGIPTTKVKFLENIFENISDEEQSQEWLSKKPSSNPLNESEKNITEAGDNIEADLAGIFENFSDDDFGSSESPPSPKEKEHYEHTPSLNPAKKQYCVEKKSLNENEKSITAAGDNIEADLAEIFENISDDDIASSEWMPSPKGKEHYEKNKKSLEKADKPNSTNVQAKSDTSSATSGDCNRKTKKADKYLDILQSIDLVQNENFESEFEKDQALDICDEAIYAYAKSDADTSENKQTHENREGILSRRKSYDKSGVKRPPEERNTVVTDVSSSCNESVTDGSSKEQLSKDVTNVNKDSVGSVINHNQHSTQSLKENEIRLGQDDKKASADKGVLWLKDPETENFIKQLNLAIGPKESAEKKKDNKQQLSKTEIKSSKRKIPNRRSSQKQCISKKDEGQKEAIQLKTSTKSNDASSSSLLDRLFNSGLLKDKRNSSEHMEPISCSQKISAEEFSESAKTENDKISSFDQETSTTSKPKSNNPLKEKSIDVELPISPKQTEPIPSPLSKTMEIPINLLEYLLNEQKTPSPKQTELEPSPLSKSSESLMNLSECLLDEQNFKHMSPKKTEPESSPRSKGSEILDSEKRMTEQIFESEPVKSVLETSNKVIFPCFSSPQKDISNLNSEKDKLSIVDREPNHPGLEISTKEVSSHLQPGREVEEEALLSQNGKPLFERRSIKTTPERQAFQLEDCLKILKLPRIQDFIEQNKSILNDLASSSIGNVTSVIDDEMTVITGCEDESMTSKVLVDEWASKDLNELHEIRFQLENDLGVDLGTLLNSGEHETPVSINTSETNLMPTPMDITEDIGNIHNTDLTNKPYQEIFPTFSSHDVSMKFFEKPNLPASQNLPQYLGLPSEIKSNDPRLRSRLTLLYAKTTDSMLQQDQVKHHMPTADQVLGLQDDRVQKEIQSACMKEISKSNFQTVTPKSIPRHQPTPSTSLKRPVARTYGEYKRMKQAAFEAEVARKKAALEAANRAHQLDMEAEKEGQKILQPEKERLKASELEENRFYEEKLKQPVSKPFQKKVTNRPYQLEMKVDKKSRKTLQAEKERLETSNFYDDTEVKKDTNKRISPESRMSVIKPHQNSDTKQEKRAKLEQNSNHNDSAEEEDVVVPRRKRRQCNLSTSSDSELDIQESPKRPTKRQKFKKRRFRVKSQDTPCKIADCTSTKSETENENSCLFDEKQDKVWKNFHNNSSDPENLKETLGKTNKKRKSTSPTTNSKAGILNREMTALNRDLYEMFIRDDVLKIDGRRRSNIRTQKRIQKLFAQENNAETSQDSSSEDMDTSKHSEEHFTEENSVDNFLLSESTKDTSKSSMGYYAICKENDGEIVKPNRRSPTFYSDEYADTDDFEEFITRKRQEEKIAKITKSQPIIKLKKLTPEEVSKKTKPTDAASPPETAPTNQSEGVDLLKPMKFKHHTDQRLSQSKRPKSKPEIKNINPNWHYKDLLFSKYCLLCCKTFEHLVNHYVISHPHKENFSSRLPAAEVTYLEEHPGTVTVKQSNKRHKYTAKCCFCEYHMKGRLYKFSHHLASHTGEFPYKCSMCDFKSCYKSVIAKHTKTECMKDAKVLKYYSYDKSDKKIYLYVCTQCNYMQLHKVNVVQHLQNEHHCSSVSEADVKELLLVDELPQSIEIVSEPVAVPSPNAVEICTDITGKQNVTKIASNESNPDICDASIDVKPEMLSNSHQDQSTAANEQTVPFFLDCPSKGDKVMAVITCLNLNKDKHNEQKIPNVEQLFRTWSSTSKESLIVAKPKRNTRTELDQSVPASVEPQEEISQKDKDTSKPNSSISPTVEVKEELTSSAPKDDMTVEEQQLSQEVLELVEDDKKFKFDIPKVSTRSVQQTSQLRVDNFGYQETREGEYVFHCLLDGCNYGATVSFQFFKDHVNAEHDIKWAGRCNICKDNLPASTGLLPISEELNHMLAVHIKELQDNDDHVSLLLKPWLNKTGSQKSKLLCEAMLSEASLCSLYKCMGDDCDYTTDSKAQMSKHLATHELKIFGTAENKRPWLECCYCQHYSEKTLQILEHVEHMHSTSIFQCSRCFYRSCESSNIRIHQNKHHSSNIDKNTTLKCSGHLKTIKNETNRLSKLKEDNVKAVACSVCATHKFFRKDLMLNHLLEAHQELDMPKDCPMGLFSCIFCDLENDQLEQIRLHMANKHPEELLYIGVRRSSDKSSTADVTSLESIGLSEKDSTTELIEVQPQQDPSSSVDSILVMSETAITSCSENIEILETNGAVEKLNLVAVTDNINQSEVVTELNDRSSFTLCTKLMESLKSFLKSEILHPCYICLEKINLENQWHNHFSAAHPSESPHVKRKCPLCSTLCTFWVYPKHFVNHHKSPSTVYFCYFCGDDFNDVTVADIHVASHLTEDRVELTYITLSQKDNTVKGDGDDGIEYSIILPKMNCSRNIDVVKQMLDVSEKRKAREALSVSTPANMDGVTINLNDIAWAANCPLYVPPAKRFICTLCSNSKWLNEKSFEDHLKTQHSTAPTFKCCHCDVTLIDLQSYQLILEHYRQHAEQIYLCWLCKMYTSNEAYLMNHMNNYNRESVPVVFFSRTPDEMQKCHVKVVHRCPLSKSSSNKMKCLFCDTFVDTFKTLDEHLLNAHAIERFYRCHYCTYHGDEGNVDAHILNHHTKSQPNVSFRSTTIYQKPLTSYAQKCGSTSNVPSKDVAIFQRTGEKRKSNDVDQPKSLAGEKKSKMDSSAIVLDRQDIDNTGKNSDPSAEGAANLPTFKCDFCLFNCFKVEEIVHHLKTAHWEIVEGNGKSSPYNVSKKPKDTTTLRHLEPAKISSTTFTPSELNKTATASLRVVPLSKLTNPAISDQRNVPHSYTSQNLHNFPHTSKLQGLLQNVSRPSTSQGYQSVSNSAISQGLQIIPRPSTSQCLQKVPLPATPQGLQNIPHRSISQGLQNVSLPSTPQGFQNVLRQSTPQELQNASRQTVSSGLQNALYPPTSKGLQNVSYPSTYQELQNVSHPSTSQGFQNFLHSSTSQRRLQNAPLLSSYQELFQNFIHPSTSQGPHQSTQKTSSRKATVKDLTYICFHCFTVCKTKVLLNMHWKIDLTCNAKKDSSFRYCIAQSPITASLLNKITTEPTEKSMCYQCGTENCSQIYLDGEFCTNHMKRSNSLTTNSYNYSQEMVLYGCDECRIFYKSEEDAVKHIARHTFRYTCIFCHSAYRSPSELWAHYFHTHQSSERRCRYVVRGMQNMQIYEQMLVVFPCGLVLTKKNLCKTSFGNMNVFAKLIDRLICQNTI